MRDVARVGTRVGWMARWVWFRAEGSANEKTGTIRNGDGDGWRGIGNEKTDDVRAR